MKILNELVELANKANAAGQGTPEMVEFRVVANPDNILAIAEAFRALEQRAEVAGAIVSDVNEIIGQLSEREWAEHCTKTETGELLEDLITDLHDEAAPAINLAELVPSKLEEKEGDYQSLRDEKRGYNACIAAILRNIEEAK